MKRNITIACAALSVLLISATEKVVVVNEGLWQSDNGRLTLIEGNEVVSNEWFGEVNGFKIGDAPSDIIQINDGMLAIAVNGSGIIQFINPDGKAIGETEAVASPRKLASDGEYLYVSSYAHEVEVNGSTLKFEKGFVAKIDIKDFNVIAASEVGYEPEGVSIYDGYLFVANSGGYSFQEQHDYESTVTMIVADTMKPVRNIETGGVNLYGKMSQSGKYLCINAAGDYYETAPATVLLDCDAAIAGKSESECCVLLDFASTYSSATTKGTFYAVGSEYSYITGAYDYNFTTIDPYKVFASRGSEGIEKALPGSMEKDIKGMMTVNGIYVNPYSGYIYVADASEYGSAGSVYQWNPAGELQGIYKVYISPAHFLAVAPEGYFNDIEMIRSEEKDKATGVYNLQGIPMKSPVKGEVYIINGRKVKF